METKLDSRQGQFPASFPDTFKNFFAMMNEDEDHMDLFSNLLEDKVIPRANKFNQRRYGGSLRCTTHPHSTAANRDGFSSIGSNVSGSATATATGIAGSAHNVGRSNSFRVNRPRNALSITSLNNVTVPGCGQRLVAASTVATANTASLCHTDLVTAVNTACNAATSTSAAACNSTGGSSNSLFCKHIKYCCLHQHQPGHHHAHLPAHPAAKAFPYKSHSQQQLFHSSMTNAAPQQQHQQQPQQFIGHYSQGTGHQLPSIPLQQPQQQQQKLYQQDFHSSTTRLGPDGGEDTNVGKTSYYNTDGSGLGGAGAMQRQQGQQQQQQQQSQTQKRHSIILERAFDLDASCDESDTISTTSSPPAMPLTNSSSNTAASVAPTTSYNTLKPILKQTQQQQQQIQFLLDQPQLPHQPPQQHHRTLPQPPRNAGIGAYHTKESALQRIQQQCGILRSASKTNLDAISVGSSTKTVIANGTTGGMSDSSSSGGGGGVANSSNNNNNSSYPAINSSSYELKELANVSSGSGGSGGGIVSGNVSNTSGSGNSNAPMYIDLHSPTAGVVPCNYGNDLLKTATPAAPTNANINAPPVPPLGSSNSSNALLAAGLTRQNMGSIRSQKSPVLNRRRSSLIATNLLNTELGAACYNRNNPSASGVTVDDVHANLRGSRTLPHAGDRMMKSPIAGGPQEPCKPCRFNTVPSESSVLTFHQAMSGAVSPQYATTTGSLGAIGGIQQLDAISTQFDGNSTSMSGGRSTQSGLYLADSPTADDSDGSTTRQRFERNEFLYNSGGGAGGGSGMPGVGGTVVKATAASVANSATAINGSTVTIGQSLGSRQRQRMRTSSMPAESRKPRLADTRRAAIHCADIDLEYYRLRSFSITSHGVCNLGDSLRSRRSRSINSVTSTGTTNSRHNSNASRTSADVVFEQQQQQLQQQQQVSNNDKDKKGQIPAYKIAMLGASGVGKTTLTYQFTTSDYICAYDLSLDDDYGQKTVSVLVDDIETDLEIIDHPACEMSTEAFCSTYNIDLFVVVYSVVDRCSFKAAEKVLQYLKENEMLLTRGAILVGNKTDLERHREVNRQMGRKLAKEIACKFIETSSGLDHNVDELLVGIVAQVKLNPQRIRNLSERDRQRLNLQNAIQKHRRLRLPQSQRRIQRQMSMCQTDDSAEENAEAAAACEHDENGDEGIGTASDRTASNSLSSVATTKLASKGPVRKTNKRPLNLESILKMGESELEDEDEVAAHAGQIQFYSPGTPARTPSKFEILTANIKHGRTPFSSVNSSPKARHASYESACATANAVAARNSMTRGSMPYLHQSETEENLLQQSELAECPTKAVSKLTSRTKVFLSSVLKFKKAIHVKRRNSSSCSDLFVI